MQMKINQWWDGLLRQSLKPEFDKYEELEEKLFLVTWFCKHEQMEFNIFVLISHPFFDIFETVSKKPNQQKLRNHSNLWNFTPFPLNYVQYKWMPLLKT